MWCILEIRKARDGGLENSDFSHLVNLEEFDSHGYVLQLTEDSIATIPNKLVREKIKREAGEVLEDPYPDDDGPEW